MDDLIADAIKLYDNCNGRLTSKDALQQAYETQTDDVWIEIHTDLSFSDSSPCQTQECWCSANIESASDVIFYANRFNSDCIVCTVCLDNKLEPDFEHVFQGKLLEDALRKIKQKRV